MESFDSYLLRQIYEKVARLGDRLAKIDQVWGRVSGWFIPASVIYSA